MQYNYMAFEYCVYVNIFIHKEAKQMKVCNPKFLKVFFCLWLIASNHCTNQSPAVTALAPRDASMILLDYNELYFFLNYTVTFLFEINII